MAQSRQAGEPVAVPHADCGGHHGRDRRYRVWRLFKPAANLQCDRYGWRADPLDATHRDSRIRLGRQPSKFDLRKAALIVIALERDGLSSELS
jgi:hypothetical protein